MTDVYTAVEAISQTNRLPLATICDVLNVSRSAFYDWLKRKPGMRQQELTNLTPMIVSIFRHHRHGYGASRISEELWDYGIDCSEKRVAKILKIQGLFGIQPKSFVPKTTVIRHTLGYSPNLLLDAPEPTRVDELWVDDINYLPLKGGGFCYLVGLMDWCSRDIVGWSLD